VRYRILLYFFCIFFLAVISLPAQTFPIPGLSQAELSALSRGERLFSVLDSYSDLRIPKGVALAKGLRLRQKA